MDNFTKTSEMICTSERKKPKFYRKLICNYFYKFIVKDKRIKIYQE